MGITVNKPIRHGEIMLVPVGEVPNGKTGSYNAYIVGHSETGHHHVLEATKQFEMTEADKDLYIRLFEPAKLVHKKSLDAHKTLTISPGIYRVVHKTEYNPWDQVLGSVFD